MKLVVTFCLLYGENNYSSAVYEYDNMTEHQAVAESLRKVKKAHSYAKIVDYRVEEEKLSS